MEAQEEAIKKKWNFYCRNIISLWNTLWLTLLSCAGDLKNIVEDKDRLWILCWWRLKIPLNSCWIILKGKYHVSAVDYGYLLALWQGKTDRHRLFNLGLSVFWGECTDTSSDKLTPLTSWPKEEGIFMYKKPVSPKRLLRCLISVRNLTSGTINAFFSKPTFVALK